MGRRGPKPEAAVIKEKKGNPGHRPIGADPAPQQNTAAKKIALSPPSWLKERKGIEVWKRIAPRLVSLKLITTADVETFGRYCRTFSRWLEMQAKIDKQGLTRHVKSNHGEWDRPHPLLLPCDRLEVRLQAFEACFGLNPADRQRIFAARSMSADPAAGDLFGRDQRPDDPASRPSPPSRTSEGPIGLLN